MKSVTRKALSISLIFHFFFFITTFYIAVQNQPIASEKANLAVELISAEHSVQPKPLLKKGLNLAFRVPTRELVPQVSPGESVPFVAAPVSVTTDMQRPALGRSLQAEVEKGESSTSLDIAEQNWNKVSTETRNLRDIKGNLSKTEAASPAGNKTFGMKRPGPPRAQRTTEVVPIKIIEEEVSFSPAQLAEIREKRKALPHIPVFKAHGNTGAGDCRNKRGESH